MNEESSDSEMKRASCENEPKAGPSQINYDLEDDEDEDEDDIKLDLYSSLPPSLPCSSSYYLSTEPKSEKSANNNNNNNNNTDDNNNRGIKCSSHLFISLTPSEIEMLNQNDTISGDLILRELNAMKIILHQLLEQNRDLTMLHFSTINPTGALVSMVEEDLNILTLVKHRAIAFGALDRLTSEFMDSNIPISSIINETAQFEIPTIQYDTATSTHKLKPITTTSEPLPHFPVGSYENTECSICLETKWLYHRPCCSFAACGDCLANYFASKVELGLVSIECINLNCKDFVFRDEISIRLPIHLKSTFLNLLMNFNSDGLRKTCPKCNHARELDSMGSLKSMTKASVKNPSATRVICTQCSYPWCFVCCAPWHEGITCKSYQKGDQLLYEWARRSSQGQVNAQRCPKCKILISKSSGCDHMHCLRCKTDFCYRCGDTLRRLKFFGDHYSKLSIFGCKYRYKASQPVQRKLIRGAVFGSKLVIAPVLGSLALFAGAAVIGVGIAALPFYGGVRLYRKYQNISLNGKNTNGKNNNTNGRNGRRKGLVSTGAQTVHVSFIGDNYVDEFSENGTRVV